eukprot:3887969-Pyramimonas_sp.AAC.1
MRPGMLRLPPALPCCPAIGRLSQLTPQYQRGLHQDRPDQDTRKAKVYLLLYIKPTSTRNSKSQACQLKKDSTGKKDN